MEYDVIVVGAGHAGCEAALAGARLGAKTLLLTISPDTIAAMSCNPAIGGPAAKSHLVRELDALGGEMGKVIDQTFLNIRQINESRGPAVHALRAQADKKLYQAEMTLRLERQVNLDLKQAVVTELIVTDQKVLGVVLKSGRKYFAKTVILTTGTFLSGNIVMGDVRFSGGRQGEPAADDLSFSMLKHGLKLRRFQTATPPGIHRQTVDFNKLTEQPLQNLKWGFSWRGLNPNKAQTSCWFTSTTPETIRFIQDNLHYSPIVSGSVTSKGPHFCPSIDRKVINFPHKTDHLIFLEPEGIYTEEMYLLGLTTAMPESIQEQILATIPGLEKAKIIRPGYAVEYDCLESFQFRPSLESKIIHNLFTAGQINGTSGYEEAAAQGIIAGINAVRKIRGLKPYIPSRTNSYIGVLIDDLTTKGTEEPYRMMTSLAEFRLYLRLDNVYTRLQHDSIQIGLISDDQRRFLNDFHQEVELLSHDLQVTKLNPSSPAWGNINHNNTNRGYRLKDLVLQRTLTDNAVLELYPELFQYIEPVRDYVFNEIRLDGYLSRQRANQTEILSLESIPIDYCFTFANLAGLSDPALIALKKVQPVSLGQALRIPELNQTDRVVLMMFFIKKEGDSNAGYQNVI